MKSNRRGCDVEEGDVGRAVQELIGASCLSNFAVVIILTDLMKECLFYWITKDGIQECSLDLQNGIALMDDILAGAGHGPYLNRCTLAEYFTGSGGVVQGVPGPGVTSPRVTDPKNILVLPKVDIMKRLLSPDVGDMGTKCRKEKGGNGLHVMQ